METELRIIQNKLINKALFFAILFIYPILCASIIRICYLGWTSLFYFHIAFTVAITLLFFFRKKISLETKVFLFSVVFFAFSFVGSLYFGLAAGLFFYVFVVIINTVILGQKNGIFALLAAFGGLMIAAILHSSGILKVTTDLNAYNASFNSWVSYIVAFLFVLIVSILTIGVYNKFFLKNMDALRIKIAEHENTVNELTLAKAILEKQNEDLQQLNMQYLEAKNNAEESDKLKTAFLHNISHEIRTPMNAIMGFVEILNNPGLTEEKRNKYSAIVTMNCNHLLTTITDIVTISTLETQQEKVNLEQVHINKLLSDLIQIFEPKAKLKNLQLKVIKGLTDEGSIIYTDSYKLMQILTKLLSNALKFTQNGSVEIRYQLKNDNLEFSVKDTGAGIPPEFQNKLFEHFSQATLDSPKSSGTGLGLSISQGFVKLLGGKIWVDSEPGKGSVFSFTIPYRTVL